MENRHAHCHDYDDHQTLNDIRDGLVDVIDYNKTVGSLLEYLMAEVGRLAREERKSKYVCEAEQIELCSMGLTNFQ